jgi:hypothetical protein
MGIASTGPTNMDANAWNLRLRRGLQMLRSSAIRTLCMVGSHQFTASIPAVHDVDVCIICDPLCAASFGSLAAQLTDLTTRLSSSEVLVSLEMRLGPLKPEMPPPGQKRVQIHGLMLDETLWGRLKNEPSCWAWIRSNTHIRGIPLQENHGTFRPTRVSWIRYVDGTLKSILKRSVMCREYRVNGQVLTSQRVSVTLTESGFAQFVCSSPHQTLCGLHHLIDCGSWQDEFPELGHIVGEVEDTHREALHSLHQLKARLRDGDQRAVGEATRMAEQVSSILTSVLYQLRCRRHRPIP